ncbi:MAG: polymerase sigma-H factor [Frankiales bacterium]|nr:polymerase sigma-H factor [Frankiales bacterium]
MSGAGQRPAPHASGSAQAHDGAAAPLVTDEPGLALTVDLDSALVHELHEVERLVDDLGAERAVEQSHGRAAEDLRLVALARSGDQAAMTQLLTDYRSFARARARSYFLAGADREDVIQEGMIGLYKAVRDFDPTRRASFRSFAELCITRQVQTAVKAAQRHKHGPLNDYVSFSRPVGGEGESERVLGDVLPAPVSNDPADLLLAAERLRGLQAHVDEVLSDLETEVLRMWVDGRSYTEIAERLQRQVKSIDNALQRIKRKLEVHLQAQQQAERD